MTKEEKLSRQRAKILWCVHILGPDEMVAKESYEAAEKHARELTDALYESTPLTGDILCLPIVAVWPWSADAHRTALAAPCASEGSNG